MSFAARLIHTVTIYNSVEGAEDRYGNAIQGFDGGTESRALVQAQLTGGQSREELNNMDRRTQSYLVFLPKDASLDGLSHIEWNGHRMSVFGDPTYQYDGRGLHHIEVTTEEISGG